MTDSKFSGTSYITRREWILRYSTPLKSFFFTAGPMILIMLVTSLYGIIDKQLTLNFAMKQLDEQIILNSSNFVSDSKQLWSPNITGAINNGELIVNFLGVDTPTITRTELAKQIINVSTQYSNTIITIIQAVALFTSVGTSIRFGIAMGARDKQKMNNVVITGFIQTLILVTIATIILHFLYPFIITSQAGIEYGKRYESFQFTIASEYTEMFVYGLSLLTISSFISTLLRTEGKVWWVIGINVIAVILNVIFGIVFMEILGLGMRGAVYGSMVAWSFGIIAGTTVIITSKDSMIKPNFKEFKWNFKDALMIWYVGLSPLLSNLVFAIVSYTSTILITHMHEIPGIIDKSAIDNYIYIFNKSGTIGEINSNGILNSEPSERISNTLRILSSSFPWLALFYSPVIGCSQGANVNYSYSTGAEKKQKIVKIFKIQVIVNIIWLAFVVVVVIAFGGQMLAAFSGPIKYKWWFVMYISPIIFGGFTFSVISLYQGIGYSKIATLISISRSLLIQVTFIFIGWGIAKNISDNGDKDWVFFLMNGLQEIPAFVLALLLVLKTYKNAKLKGELVDKPDDFEEISYSKALRNEFHIQRNKYQEIINIRKHKLPPEAKKKLIDRYNIYSISNEEKKVNKYEMRLAKKQDKQEKTNLHQIKYIDSILVNNLDKYNLKNDKEKERFIKNLENKKQYLSNKSIVK